MPKIIGIVGGVGPVAGVDLHSKIIARTNAKSDQQHLSICHLSFSCDIADRTQYLLDKLTVNPAHALYEVIEKLHGLGARVIGVPCNTAHAEPIFSVLTEKTQKMFPDVVLVHMIAAVFSHISALPNAISRVGLLGTQGLYHSKVYQALGEEHNIAIIAPHSDADKEDIHSAIYSKEFGVKSTNGHIHPKAREIFSRHIALLQDKGAQAIIMGCTEIPLAVEKSQHGIPCIDPTDILAEQLVLHATS